MKTKDLEKDKNSQWRKEKTMYWYSGGNEVDYEDAILARQERWEKMEFNGYSDEDDEVTEIYNPNLKIPG